MQCLPLAAADSPVPALPPEPASSIAKLSPDQVAAFRSSLEKSRQETGLPGMAVALIQ